MSDKSGSPPCGIYVRIDDFSNMLDIIGHIRKIAFAINRASGYEMNMSVIELAHTENSAEKITDLIPIIKAQGLVSIIGGDIGDIIAEQGADNTLGADGFVLKTPDQAKTTRTALGDDILIGLHGKNTKDTQNILNLGIDFITLDADPSLISLWRAKTDILCVADGKNTTNRSCGALATAGAHFVQTSNYILNHEKDATQGTVNILYALECIAKQTQTLN